MSSGIELPLGAVANIVIEKPLGTVGAAADAGAAASNPIELAAARAIPATATRMSEKDSFGTVEPRFHAAGSRREIRRAVGPERWRLGPPCVSVVTNS